MLQDQITIQFVFL